MQSNNNNNTKKKLILHKFSLEFLFYAMNYHHAQWMAQTRQSMLNSFIRSKTIGMLISASILSLL